MKLEFFLISFFLPHNQKLHFFLNPRRSRPHSRFFFLGARLAGQVGTACCGSTRVRSTLGPWPSSWLWGATKLTTFVLHVCYAKYKYHNMYNICVLVCKYIYIYVICLGYKFLHHFWPENSSFPSNLTDLGLSFKVWYSCLANVKWRFTQRQVPLKMPELGNHLPKQEFQLQQVQKKPAVFFGQTPLGCI